LDYALHDRDKNIFLGSNAMAVKPNDVEMKRETNYLGEQKMDKKRNLKTADAIGGILHSVSRNATSSRNHLAELNCTREKFMFLGRTYSFQKVMLVAVLLVTVAVSSEALALEAPTGVSASDGDVDKIQIAWDSVANASHYRVSRVVVSTQNVTSAVQVQNDTALLGTWQIETSYDDTSAIPGMMYRYRVKAAMNSSGDGASAFSYPDTGWRKKLEVPTGVAASNGTYTNKVCITWNSLPNADSYRVYRAESLGGTKTALGDWQTGTSYDDTLAVQGQTYCYWVTAISSSDQFGEYSGHATGWRNIDPPTEISATNGTSTEKVSVTWNSVTGANLYRVCRAESKGGAKTALGGWQTGTSYDDILAIPGQTYYYWVKATISVNAKVAVSSEYGVHDTGWRKIDGPEALPTKRR